MTAKASLDTDSVKRCPRCGLTEADLRAHGLMGCATCYQAFDAMVVQATTELHGTAVPEAPPAPPAPLAPHTPLPWPTRRAETHNPPPPPPAPGKRR